MEHETQNTLETALATLKEWLGNPIEYSFESQGESSWNKGLLSRASLSSSHWLLISVQTPTENGQNLTKSLDVPPGSRVDTTGNTLKFTITEIENRGYLRLRLQ